MAVKCIVNGCTSVRTVGSTRQFYKFPKSNTEVYSKWLSFCNVNSFKIKVPSICDKHFEENVKCSKYLFRNAVPTLHKPSQEVDIKIKKKKISALKCIIEICPNRRGVSTDYKFFRFPEKTSPLYKQWIDACGLPEKHEKLSWKVICSNHFESTDYGHNLKRNAVPSKNFYNRNVEQGESSTAQNNTESFSNPYIDSCDDSSSSSDQDIATDLLQTSGGGNTPTNISTKHSTGCTIVYVPASMGQMSASTDFRLLQRSKTIEDAETENDQMPAGDFGIDNANGRKEREVFGSNEPTASGSGTMPPSQTMKRLRSNESGGNTKVPTRRQSFSETVKDELNIAILDKSEKDGKMTELRVALFRYHLMKVVVEGPCEEPPNFNSSGLVRGNFFAFCENKATKYWLNEQVPNWVPWKGAKLQVVEQSQLPKSSLFHVFVPSDEEVEAEVILKRIGCFNKKLSTADWHVVKFERRKLAEDKTPGYFLIVDIDEVSAAEITGPLKMRPYYAMTRIAFAKHGGKETELVKAAEPAKAVIAVEGKGVAPDGETCSL